MWPGGIFSCPLVILVIAYNHASLTALCNPFSKRLFHGNSVADPTLIVVLLVIAVILLGVAAYVVRAVLLAFRNRVQASTFPPTTDAVSLSLLHNGLTATYQKIMSDMAAESRTTHGPSTLLTTDEKNRDDRLHAELDDLKKSITLMNLETRLNILLTTNQLVPTRQMLAEAHKLGLQEVAETITWHLARQQKSLAVAA